MGSFGDNNPDNPWLSIIGDKPIIANEFSLMGNYPNPFNPSTSIIFNMDVSSHVNVKIFNLMGEEVRTLQNNSLEAGFHSVTWNARNNFGKEVPSGMYFYSIESNGRTLTGKMLLLK
jgi:flagellar hook assembly protein FlgD